MPEAAERARVSRATAYRYFPTQDALLSELAVTLNTQPVEQLLASFDTDEVEERMVQVLDASASIALADEYLTPSGLRVFLDQWIREPPPRRSTPVREGRRMRWLDQVSADVLDLQDSSTVSAGIAHSASSRVLSRPHGSLRRAVEDRDFATHGDAHRV